MEVAGEADAVGPSLVAERDRERLTRLVCVPVRRAPFDHDAVEDADLVANLVEQHLENEHEPELPVAQRHQTRRT
jgi:hypothetical protein